MLGCSASHSTVGWYGPESLPYTVSVPTPGGDPSTGAEGIMGGVSHVDTLVEAVLRLDLGDVSDPSLTLTPPPAESDVGAAGAGAGAGASAGTGGSASEAGGPAQPALDRTAVVRFVVSVLPKYVANGSTQFQVTDNAAAMLAGVSIVRTTCKEGTGPHVLFLSFPPPLRSAARTYASSQRTSRHSPPLAWCPPGRSGSTCRCVASLGWRGLWPRWPP